MVLYDEQYDERAMIMSGLKTEYEVEKIFINQLNNEQGYSYIDMANYDDVLANFRVQFCKVNAKALIEAKGVAELSDSEFNKVLLRLENHTIYESAKVLREKWVLELDSGKTIYAEFLTSDIYRNTYQVTHQVTMDKAHKDDVEYKNRYDVTVLINGLPLVQIELKRSGVELNEAINQINRYRTYSFKGLFRFIQIFVVSNSVQTKYFANTNERKADGTEQLILKSLAFYWTDRNNIRINRLGEFTQDFFDKFSLTEMLTKFMVIKETEVVSGLHTMACRPTDKYAPKYMGYYINSPTYHNQLLPFMQGIKVTSIGRRNIADTVVYYPYDIEEQQKIADFLSALNEAISYAKQELNKWKELKKGLLQQMFV